MCSSDLSRTLRDSMREDAVARWIGFSFGNRGCQFSGQIVHDQLPALAIFSRILVSFSSSVAAVKGFTT